MLPLTILSAGCEFKFGGGGKRGKDGRDAIAPVVAQPVTRSDVSSYLHLNAALEAVHEVRLFARTTGRIVNRPAQEADRVKAGQLLILLDDEEQKLALAKAEAAYSRDSSAYKRATQLFEQGMLSDDEYQRTSLLLREAALTVEQARLALNYTRITAPFAGAVANLEVNVGDRVDPSRPLLTLVGDELQVNAYVSPAESQFLSTGAMAEVFLHNASKPVAQARFARFSPVIDPAYGKVKVVFEIEQPPQQLQPGQFVTLQLELERHENVLTVPRQALIYSDERPEVFVKIDSLAHKRRVTLGLSSGDIAEVLSGLAEGDSVIIEGHTALRDSARIKLIAR